MEKETRINISESRLAKLLKISERKIRSDFKEARVSPGKYNLLECIEIYVEKNGNIDEKNKLLESQRKLNDKKLEILNNKYVHVDEIEEAFSEMLFNFKNKLLSINKKIRVALIGQDEKKYDEIIMTHLLTVLSELKKFEGYGDLEKNEQDGETTKQTNKKNISSSRKNNREAVGK